MTTQSLFYPADPRTFFDEAEAHYNMSLRYHFTKAGTIDWIGFIGSANTLTVSPFGAVYEPGGAQRYTQSFGNPALLLTNQWNILTLTTPVNVEADETLDVVVGPKDRYSGAGGLLPRDNDEGLSASGSFFKVTVTDTLEQPDSASSAWFAIDIGFTPAAIVIDGTFQATAPAVTLSGAGRLLIPGGMSAGITGFNLSAEGRLVIAGGFAATAPSARLLASNVTEIRSILTPGGSTASTLTAGGSAASTLTASGL